MRSAGPISERIFSQGLALVRRSRSRSLRSGHSLFPKEFFQSEILRTPYPPAALLHSWAIQTSACHLTIPPWAVGGHCPSVPRTRLLAVRHLRAVPATTDTRD